jgi:isopenicillin N synthase-like dioxygenase
MNLPLIDLGALRSDRGDVVQGVAHDIGAASEDVGFFYVVNHGVTDTQIGDALAAAKAFFALPVEQKQGIAVDRRHRGYLGFGGARMDDAELPDLKETFVYGVERPLPTGHDGSLGLVGPNHWPSEVPELERALYSFFQAVISAGRQLLVGIALALDLPGDFFVSKVEDPLARGSVIHYPRRSASGSPAQFGVGAHTDYGLVTLLWQDEVGGLEVETTGGRWVSAPPVAGTLVVNVGDLLARWSNDRLKSNPHRVVNHGEADRYSMAVFLDPAFDTVVDPRHCGLDPEVAPLYEPLVAGEHIARRFESAFAYRQNS